jgi:hypothetical protein
VCLAAKDRTRIRLRLRPRPWEWVVGLYGGSHPGEH